MLFGEHAVVYGKPCIVTAVDQKITVKVASSGEGVMRINAPDLSLRNYEKDLIDLGKGNVPRSAKFLEFGVRNFFRKYEIKTGINIETKSGFSSQFGFGSSSAVTVALIKALTQLFDVDLDNKELFDICYRTVLDVQGVGSGFDLASAIWGGTIYFDGNTKKTTPLHVKELPLVVGYSGVKADTTTLVKQVADLKVRYPEQVDRIFDLMGEIVEKAKSAILKKDFKTVGELANLNQGLLNSLGVSSEKLEDLIFAAREAGAYGAKLSGAGGGDCMISFVPEARRLQVGEAITSAGGKIIYVKTGAEGVGIE